MSLFNRGANDKNQNKGPVDPNKFKSDKERKDYYAGYKQKEKELQQKKK